MLFHLKTLMPLKVVFFRDLDVGGLSILLRISTTTFFTDDSDENLTYREAMKSSPKSDWVEATRKEYNALTGNKTWVLSPLAPVLKAIGIRWFFKIKRHDDGTTGKFKARFVGQGFLQVYGSDYDETFAPIAKLCTLRICFAVAASWSTFVFQSDVHAAFLADLSYMEFTWKNLHLDAMYIDQPEGFAQRGLMVNHFIASFKNAFMVWSKQRGNGTKP